MVNGLIVLLTKKVLKLRAEVKSTRLYILLAGCGNRIEHMITVIGNLTELSLNGRWRNLNFYCASGISSSQ